MDANFWLKGHNHGVKDKEFGPGWAYFVEPQSFKRVMSTFGNQTEVKLKNFCNVLNS